MTDQEARQADAKLHTLLTGEAVTQGVTQTHYYGPDLEPVPHYHTTWEGMGLVIERMDAKGYLYVMGSWDDGTKHVFFRKAGNPWRHYGYAKSLPEAVSKAATAALEADE